VWGFRPFCVQFDGKGLARGWCISLLGFLKRKRTFSLVNTKGSRGLDFVSHAIHVVISADFLKAVQI
jgi:hypothetical protein